MTKARSLILVGTVIGLLIAYSRLIGHHYYKLTYAACARGVADDICTYWNRQGVVEALIVIGLASAAWIYFDKRDALKDDQPR